CRYHTRDLPEAPRRDIRVRVAKVRAIRQIEKLGPELETLGFRDCEILEDPEVESEESGTLVDIAAHIPERAGQRECERGLVEIVVQGVLLGPVTMENGVAHDVGPLPACAVGADKCDVPAVRKVHRSSAARGDDRRQLPSVHHLLQYRIPLYLG